MKKSIQKRTWTFAFVILCIIWVASSYFIFMSETQLSRGDLLFENFKEKIAQIDNIHFEMEKADLVLQKQNPNQWILTSHQDFPADAKNIVHFMYNVDRFRVGHVIETENPTSFGLGDSTRMKVTFTTNGQDSIVLECGNLIAHPKQIGATQVKKNAVGRYYSNGQGQVFAVAQPLEVLDNGIAPWITKDLIRIEHIAVMQFRGNHPWSAVRATPDTYFSFAGAAKTTSDDAEKMMVIARLWEQPNSADIDEFKNVKSEPLSTLKLITFEGITYEINFYLHNNRLFYRTAIVNQEPVARHYKLRLESGRSVLIPRSTTELNDKIQREKHLSNWVYTIPNETYEYISRLMLSD